MSAEAVGWVYRYSPYKGATFAVHLAIADSVNDQNGNEFWMLEKRLSAKARVSRRSSTEALSAMLRDGWLIRLEGAVKLGHPARYSFVFKKVEVAYESRFHTRATTAHVNGTREQPVHDTRANERATREQPLLAEPKEVQPKKNPTARSRSLPRADDFIAWYTAYPKHVARGDAEKAWKTLASELPSLSDLLLATKNYANSREVERGFVKLPATWLRAKCWLDEYDAENQRVTEW